MSIKEMNQYLEKNLKPSRYKHTLGVVETAKKLAKLNKVCEEKAEIAALAHDIAKNLTEDDMKELMKKNGIILSQLESNNSNLWHSIVAPLEAVDKFEIYDEDILDAVRWHTTGKENMSDLTKIIYISDMIEPNRNFPGIDIIRELTFENLDKGILYGLSESIKDLLNRNLLIDLNTIKARNYLML